METTKGAEGISDHLTFEEALVDYPDLWHQVKEMQSEVDRHHRDFAKISELCDNWTAHAGQPFMVTRAISAIRQIRKIVG